LLRLLFYSILVIFFSLSNAWCVTENGLREAILEKKTFSSEMDLNDDGKIDVADIVSLLAGMGSPTCDGIVGNHIGTFYRDGGDLISGRPSDTGQITFALKVWSDSPLQAEIDNLAGSEMGHFSLYFPADKIPVQVERPTPNTFNFEFEFTTTSSNLSPDIPLQRHIVFEGEFTDDAKRVLGGMYKESISGFRNNLGVEIPIELEGSFLMVLDCNQ
jgi:hypothetical protein